MDTANLIAIDTHTHLEVSCRNPFDAYRAMKIGFVDFTVDAETQMGRRRIPNEEIGKTGGREARKLVEEYGVRGFEFHPTVQGFDVTDRMAWPISGVIAGHELPAIFHSGHSGIGSGMR